MSSHTKNFLLQDFEMKFLLLFPVWELNEKVCNPAVCKLLEGLQVQPVGGLEQSSKAELKLCRKRTVGGKLSIL